MKKLTITLTLAMLAACAKQPENISAVEIGPNSYNGYSCTQLSEAHLSKTQQLENFSAKQKSAAASDTVGVLLLGLPVSSLAGTDSETEIAVLKGHLQAIDRELARKRCR